MAPRSPLFKTPEGEAEYMRAYEACLVMFPAPYEALDIPTRFGNTRVHSCGPAGAPPLALLPGLLASGMMWLPNLAPLSRNFRVYVVDILGDVGRSRATAVPATRAEAAEWLTSVFDELRIDRPGVVGASYGAFLALNLALRWPERVRRLALLAPAGGIVRFSATFLLRMYLPKVLPSQCTPSIDFMVARGNEKTVPRDLRQLLFLAMRHGRPALKLWPAVVTDDELRRLRTPTLLMIGEGEVIYRAASAVERARKLIPHVETEVVPNSSHLFTIEQAATVNARLLAFFEGGAV